MKIEKTPKETADLVSELQGQQVSYLLLCQVIKEMQKDNDKPLFI